MEKWWFRETNPIPGAELDWILGRSDPRSPAGMEFWKYWYPPGWFCHLREYPSTTNRTLVKPGTGSQTAIKKISSDTEEIFWVRRIKGFV
jgi:hypothetical protein